MTTQKAISAKVDEQLLQELDSFLQDSYLKRNTVINLALRMWLDARKAKAEDMHTIHEDDRPSPLVLKFIRENLTYRAKFYLDLIDYH